MAKRKTQWSSATTPVHHAIIARQEETVRLLRYEYDKAAQYQRRQDETVRRLETAVAEQHSASMARYNV